MPKTYRPTKPYLLGQPVNVSQAGARFNPGLAEGSRYRAFDLVELDANGFLIKSTAPTGTSRFAMANKSWNQPFASKIYNARREGGEEWYRRFGNGDNIVFGMSLAWAEDMRGTVRTLTYTAADGILELGAASTTATGMVRVLMPVFEVSLSADAGNGFGSETQQRYEVGDIRVPVVCEWVEGKVL